MPYQLFVLFALHVSFPTTALVFPLLALLLASCVSREGATVTAFEVRDKPVNGPDAYHFINKASSANVNSAGIVTVATNQEQIAEQDLEEFAYRKAVNLQVFYSWRELVAAASFWGDRQLDWQHAVERIHSRALELGVSEAGIRQWEDLAHSG